MHERGERTQDLAVHHDLPRIYWQVCVVETPIELLLRDRLVRRVVVERHVGVRERLGRVDALLRVEDEHLLEQVDR